MNHRTVMQQALYALEKAHHAMQADTAQEVIEDAIDALRSALAQEPVCNECGMKHCECGERDEL